VIEYRRFVSRIFCFFVFRYFFFQVIFLLSLFMLFQEIAPMTVGNEEECE